MQSVRLHEGDQPSRWPWGGGGKACISDYVPNIFFVHVNSYIDVPALSVQEYKKEVFPKVIFSFLFERGPRNVLNRP